jgi:hypothetical protein
MIPTAQRKVSGLEILAGLSNDSAEGSRGCFASVCMGRKRPRQFRSA